MSQISVYVRKPSRLWSRRFIRSLICFVVIDIFSLLKAARTLLIPRPSSLNWGGSKSL
jgi:hypothetical protein